LIEEYIKASGIPYTFVRPTNFMENTPPPGIGRFFFFGAMKALFGQDKVYHIAVEDIGKLAAKSLTDENMKGRAVDLVGQIAGVDEMKNALDKAEGYTSWQAWVPRWLVMAVLPYELSQMFKVRFGGLACLIG
jgi:uncharacterized protein YbjT (DUF2867 family)